MKIRLIGAAFAALSLCACQSANQGKTQWVQIQAGDVFDVADAKCKLWASQFEQGMYAQGTAGFVIGAQLGNAIGNAIREQQAYNQCMTISGWKQIPLNPAVRPVKKSAAKARTM